MSHNVYTNPEMEELRLFNKSLQNQLRTKTSRLLAAEERQRSMWKTLRDKDDEIRLLKVAMEKRIE